MAAFDLSIDLIKSQFLFFFFFLEGTVLRLAIKGVKKDRTIHGVELALAALLFSEESDDPGNACAMLCSSCGSVLSSSS